MNRSKRQQHLAAEAADWVVALADADGNTKTAFADWLRESPEHIREFLAVSAIWSTLPELPQQPSVEELVRTATTPSNVVALAGADARGGARTPVRPGGRARWAGRAAAVLCAALGAAAILMFLPPDQAGSVHATMTGEQSSMPLPDGSVVNLNTRSTVRVAYSRHFRDVHLVDGEALFDASNDAARPFRVMTDQAVIVALGTTFNVRDDGDEVTVTVVEGIVEVAPKTTGGLADSQSQDRASESSAATSPVRLRNGQQARVQSRSVSVVLAEDTVEKAIAWREQRLVFEDLPLKDVIDEFNRYNESPVVIADKQLETLLISGVFRSDDRASFLQFLSQMQLAESTAGDGGSIVLNAPSPD